MKYFSIDYRSPPSGLGQIIDPSQPKKIGDKYNYTLISFDGCGGPDNPYYTETIYIDEDPFETGDLSKVFETLRSRGVVYVYDSELGYDSPELCDENHHFPLEAWIDRRS